MKTAKRDSQAIQLLDLVWRSVNSALPHSWTRVNGSMRQALFLALTSGMEFADDDFAVMSSRFNSGRWLGCDIESFYRIAVELGDSRAWKAFEKANGRKPFILDGTRMFVGREFEWRGDRVKCTSFRDAPLQAQPSFTAVSYVGWTAEENQPPRKFRDIGGTGQDVRNSSSVAGDRYERKIRRRFTITHADLKLEKNRRRALTGVMEVVYG